MARGALTQNPAPGTIAKKSGSNTTKEQQLNARRSAWERAGWKRASSDDYPGSGENFVADGDKASPPSGWVWTKAPLAKISIPGSYRRIGTVRNWSFSNTAETIDTTTLGDTYRDKVGAKSVTGQAQLMYYRTVMTLTARSATSWTPLGIKIQRPSATRSGKPPASFF